MSQNSDKEKCPYCGKMYKNLKSHVSRLHSTEKRENASTDDLEKSVASKILQEQIATSVNQTSPKEEKKVKKEKVMKEEKKKSNSFEKVIEVDFWLTNIHDAEMGIFQKERFMAKNRQFSRNLELVGAVKHPGKPDGMFGYNQDTWDNIPLKDIAKKRLVLKWFNSTSVGWLGTIEEMIVNSISSSIGADDTLPFFKIILPRYKYVVNLQKEHTKIPKIGEIFTFALKNMKEDKWDIYSLDEKRLTVGSDWDIYVGDKNRVGKIDEKLFNIGGKFKVHFYDEQLYKNAEFFRVIILFTMMLKFKQDILDKIERMKKLIKDGQIKLDIAADEERFMMNPRSLKR